MEYEWMTLYIHIQLVVVVVTRIQLISIQYAIAHLLSAHSSRSVSQLTPVYPNGHVQTYSSPWELLIKGSHDPPLRQGDGLQAD